jgi:hypothetical protein
MFGQKKFCTGLFVWQAKRRPCQTNIFRSCHAENLANDRSTITMRSAICSKRIFWMLVKIPNLREVKLKSLNSFFSIHWFLFGAIWYFFNGLLHDIFVIRQHKGKYDRELLRLLLDGHVLILSGILMLACWFMLKQNLRWGAGIAIIVSLFMLIYCGMIYPFLKSLATILFSLVLFAIALISLLNTQ